MASRLAARTVIVTVDSSAAWKVIEMVVASAVVSAVCSAAQKGN
jgi:hypothetical protein